MPIIVEISSGQPCNTCVTPHILLTMGAGHDHASPGTPAPRLAIATALLGGFFVVELTTALTIGSISLLADAGHILTDVAATFMGLCAVILAQRGSTSPARTYGWHRAEVFTAVANAVLLIGVATLILREAIGRIGQAPEVPGIPMVVVALIGLATNARGRAAAAIAVDAEPGRQGRLHGGDRRHGRQHRCADRRSGHDHHALALRRRGGRRPGRAMGAAAGAVAGRGRVADPVRVVAQPHQRRRPARGTGGGRRRDRGARSARLDAGARQGHGDRAPDQLRRLRAGTERRAGHPRRRAASSTPPSRSSRRATAQWASSRATAPAGC